MIFDRRDQFLAVGLYDPGSPIRVRIIHRGKPAAISREWWRDRLREAIKRRDGIFDAGTNGGRRVNGESDGFPALVLDSYGDALVLKLYSGIWFGRLAEMADLIREELAPSVLILRLSRNIQAGAREFGWTDGQALIGRPPTEPVLFRESGLMFEADVIRGQKTGFFLDQRENRRRVGELAPGRRVLNAFSFSGGFSLYAARAGARSVTDLDISEHALESSRRNFARNRALAGGCEHRLIQADVFKWFERESPSAYDLVVLDPPSLAKRQADRPAALKGYQSLAAAGFTRTSPGGITVCCSCSGHVRSEEFFELIRQAADRTRRPYQVLQQTQEPADHHAAFPEAAYLKAIYLAFQDGERA